MKEELHPWLNRLAPDFTLSVVDGGRLSLSDWRGFIVVVAAGVLIGYSVMDLQCGNGDGGRVVIGAPSSGGAPTTTIAPRVKSDDAGCTAWSGGSGVLGAVVGAGGTAVVAVLVLRAMAEWRRDLDVDEAPD